MTGGEVSQTSFLYLHILLLGPRCPSICLLSLHPEKRNLDELPGWREGRGGEGESEEERERKENKSDLELATVAFSRWTEPVH